MTYDIYRYIFFGTAGLGLSLAIAVILFSIFSRQSIIENFTGSTARKKIKNIRHQNESSGDKTYKSSAVNREILDNIMPNCTLIKTSADLMGGAMASTKIGTQQLAAEAQQAYENSLLEETSDETTELNIDGAGETTVIEQTEMEQGVYNSNVFVIEYEITFIHTDEVIA